MGVSFQGTETEPLLRPTFHLILQVAGKMSVHNANKLFQVKGSYVKYNIKCVDIVQIM